MLIEAGKECLRLPGAVEDDVTFVMIGVAIGRPVAETVAVAVVTEDVPEAESREGYPTAESVPIVDTVDIEVGLVPCVDISILAESSGSIKSIPLNLFTRSFSMLKASSRSQKERKMYSFLKVVIAMAFGITNAVIHWRGK